MSNKSKSYYIQTFGCQQNVADSERLAGYYKARGYEPAAKIENADIVIINTCMVREQAEDRIYGLVNNLLKLKIKNKKLKIVITGCLVGAMFREPTGKLLKKVKERLPSVDEFLPIEEVGFESQAIRQSKKTAIVPITSGCNNFCSFCIVPFARGKEQSRPFARVIQEVQALARKGYKEIMLVGQNVNSYGADLIKSNSEFKLPNGKLVKPIMVKHLGKKCIPTLFPYLLEQISQIEQIKKITFMSSNPWDFSDELIKVLAKNKKIDRFLHLPVQSGDDFILKKMNRWYRAKEYLSLINKIKKQIKGVKFSTDIIVGFPGESLAAFNNTVKLVKKVGFVKAYVSCYSPRPGTVAAKMSDDVPHPEKDRRFHFLNRLINKK